MPRTDRRRLEVAIRHTLLVSALAAAHGVESAHGQAPATVVTTAITTGATTPPREQGHGQGTSGIIFRGKPEQIAQIKMQMRDYLADLACPTHLVLAIEPLTGDQISFTLNTPTGDTDTFALADRLGWAMPLQSVAFQDRNDVFQTRELVSEAEVLASMMQHGRGFVFSGATGSVDKLREHVAIRRNIVYWGLRAAWVFPEPLIPRYNTNVWNAAPDYEWTLKPGISVRRAVADAFEGGLTYEIGCTSACKFIYAQGIFDYFATSRRDPKMLAHLEQTLDPVRPLSEVAPTKDPGGAIRRGRLAGRHDDVAWNHWVPGDWGYIKNTDERSSNELGSEGSNIIYSGGGKFVNYYAASPPRTLDESLKRVYRWRFIEGPPPAELTAEETAKLRLDPRVGGLLRDVRDVPLPFDSQPNE